jgi:hypothetical protein
VFFIAGNPLALLFGCHVVSVPEIRIRQKTLRWYLFGFLHRIFLPTNTLVDRICLCLYKQITLCQPIDTADNDPADSIPAALPVELQLMDSVHKISKLIQ